MDPAPPRPVVPPAALSRPWHLLGVLVLVVAALPIVHRYLVAYPDDQWQVDLEVYREAGISLLVGRPVYDVLTEAPQLLPFTYPTFSAVLAVPLAFVPFLVAGWLWTAFQLALLYVTVGLAFRPLLDRVDLTGRVPRGLVQGLVAAACVWVSPVGEGIRFGQVNAILVLLCLLDVVRGQEGVRVGRWWLRWPRGLLIGLAVAIKLTPGVFLVHFVVTRQWRELRNAVAGAVGATVAAFLVAPEASAEYWTSALLSSDRLGPNAGSSNQSLRGFVLRLYLSDGATQLLWLGLVAVFGTAAFLVARAMYRRGSRYGEVAACGLAAILVSPVSWLHHLHWGVLAIAAVLGAARVRRRVVVAVALYAGLVVAWPWWGANLLAGSAPVVLARFVQNGDLWWAMLALLALHRCVRDTAGDHRNMTKSDQSVA
ncbi:glycosyltransferase 87 family protein [Kineococcus gynurae]|uniref:Glycosyltransferase 87 family protein n=1 Tax=Kineococcus gynurae TaxID=452979 RepID=A0ABV5LSH6_9ACTN